MISKHEIQNIHVLVIGDVMLDEYVFGTVDRVSPEAPVPVVRVSSRKTFLGGAGNVAAGVRALGAQVTLIGAVGRDKPADIFRTLVEQCGVTFAGICENERKTTVKTRVIGNDHQIVRYDEETIEFLKDTDLLLKLLMSIADKIDVLVISDYAKGVCGETMCSEAIQAMKHAGKPVIVDPKSPDWAKFSGADIITPNFEELKAALNMPDIKNSEDVIREHAPSLAKKYNLGGILVTRSRHGMTYASRDGRVFTEKATAREVFDVSGAGDTVASALSVFFNAPLETAVSLANTAASIAVGKLGTSPVTYGELLSVIERERHVPKLYSADDLAALIKANNNKRVVFTNGCFDILHSGHVTLLERAKREGGFLVVGLNSDSSVRRLKGKDRPINNERDRALVLASLACVDAVVIFSEDTPFELIRRLEPDVLVKGADYSEDAVVGADLIKSRGGKVVIVPLIENKSTTAIVEQIKG